jgi:hypothetical protein
MIERVVEIRKQKADEAAEEPHELQPKPQPEPEPEPKDSF